MAADHLDLMSGENDFTEKKTNKHELTSTTSNAKLVIKDLCLKSSKKPTYESTKAYSIGTSSISCVSKLIGSTILIYAD